MSERSERVKYFQQEKRNFVSPSGHVMFYQGIYYINTNEIPNHFDETVFSCKRRDLLCSHRNGDIFTHENNMIVIFMCEDIMTVFARKLTSYFTGV